MSAAASAQRRSAHPIKAHERAEIFSRWRAANPAPQPELVYSSPFELLVAVVLSAQATDRSVNAATGPLFAAANTPQAMRALGEAGIAEYVRSIGLFRSKSRHLAATCAILVDKHGGEVPRERAALEALPGVGRKTANVILNIAFGEPVIAVDTHVFRVANRTGIAPGETPSAVETALEQTVPQEFLVDAHHWLILHGRYVCLARKPRCGQCLIADLCAFPDKTASGDEPPAPAPGARRKRARA